ncbi:hypothetical protein GCM10009850_045570 [Nonomuraea monospora]|uniref:Major facilitator superfamily (MFS) profile domain-containing protein n=1 Tax=Nonomuraea monospora TaxID=568818 RepID=A0ABP5PBS3_9ACTN
MIAFALTLNLSAGNVILPAVERDLGITSAVSRWVVLGYALATVAFIPVAGRVGRRAGVRRALVWGVGGFGVVSVVCALAPEVVTLLAGRLVLAAFAALLTILTAVLAVSGPGGKAGAGASRGGHVGGLAVAAVCATLGGFAGAAAGGGLVSPLGWRALLLLPVPLCLLALTARLPDTQTSPPATPTTSPTTTSLAATSPTTTSPAATSPATPASAASASAGPSRAAVPSTAISPTATLANANANADTDTDTDTDSTLPALPARALTLLTTTLLSTIDALMIVLSPFFLFQGQVMQAPLPLVGLTVMGLPAGLMAGAILATRLTARIGPRPVTVTGALLAALGLALLLPLSPTWSAAEVALRLAVVGAGMGLSAAPAHSMIMTDETPVRPATHLQFGRTLGYVLGATLAATLWAAEGFARAGVATALLPALGSAAVAALSLIPYRSMTTRRPSLQRPGAPWTPTRSRV